jgi:hypothetical protein
MLIGTPTMSARRLIWLTGAAALALALSQGTALAHTRHHHHADYHARYAGEWSRDTAAELDPYGGPTLIASRPVPDTPFNRARFGGPMSYGGRMTAPVGN